MTKILPGFPRCEGADLRVPCNPLTHASYGHQRTWATGVRGFLSRRLPRALRQHMKFVALLPVDALDSLLGRRAELVPPRRLNHAGDGDFEATGNEFLNYFIQIAGLQPGRDVLEIGCGIGRMARPLTKYLAGGSYVGIDIVPKGIQWCQKEISSRYPQFHFQLADIQNSMYNPKGRFTADQYRFPFGDGAFDFVFLTSVFTHMTMPGVENYVREIGRMLRPSGKCLITFFLLNHEAFEHIDNGRSSLGFQFLNGSYIADPRNPERAVGFEEGYIRERLLDAGLNVQTVRYGGWCGRQAHLSYQDIVVAGKQ